MTTAKTPAEINADKLNRARDRARAKLARLIADEGSDTQIIRAASTVRIADEAADRANRRLQTFTE